MYDIREEAVSIGELFGTLMDDVRTLIRQEIELARVELSQKASQAAKGVAFMAIGGLLAYAGLLVLLATAVIALALVLPAWLSALIVGGVVAILGGILVLVGMNRMKADRIAPRQTMESIQEDKEWLQQIRK